MSSSSETKAKQHVAPNEEGKIFRRLPDAALMLASGTAICYFIGHLNTEAYLNRFDLPPFLKPVPTSQDYIESGAILIGLALLPLLIFKRIVHIVKDCLQKICSPANGIGFNALLGVILLLYVFSVSQATAYINFRSPIGRSVNPKIERIEVNNIELRIAKHATVICINDSFATLRAPDGQLIAIKKEIIDQIVFQDFAGKQVQNVSSSSIIQSGTMNESKLGSNKNAKVTSGTMGIQSP